MTLFVTISLNYLFSFARQYKLTKEPLAHDVVGQEEISSRY